MQTQALPAVPNREGPIDYQLRFAIANKRLIEVRYGGSLRVAEPHDYGVQKGVTRLLIYQLRSRGWTQGRGVRGWRLLDVPKIGACVVLQDTFSGTRGEPHQRHYLWDAVYARVR